MDLNIDLTKKQKEAFDFLMDQETKELVFGGGAGGGKSWLGCEWLIIMCICYPGTRWFIGRNELKRLKTTTYVTYCKVSKAMDVTDQWKLNGQDNIIHFKNGSDIVLLDVEYKPSDPLFERLGSSEFTGGFLEEVGEVDFTAFDVLKSRCGRQYNEKYNLYPKILMTCNPKKNWVYNMFYKPFKNGTLAKGRQFLQSLVKDNPCIDKQYLENLNSISNEMIKQRLLYGSWEYEDEPEQLIKYEWCENAFFTISRHGKAALGVDVARFGNDNTTFVKMTGNIVSDIQSFHGYSIDQTADKVLDKAKSEMIDYDYIGVDSVGLGAGVVDILEKEKCTVESISAGEKVKYSFPGYETYNFYNLRAQMWFMAREDLRLQRIKFGFDEDNELINELINDLVTPKYQIVGDNTLQIEQKKDIKNRTGKSPDLGDAFIMCNYVRHLREAGHSVSISEYKIPNLGSRSLSDIMF